MSSIQQYFPNALDELQSHVTPEQFTYLLSVLHSADLSADSASVTSTTIEDSITFSATVKSDDGKGSRSISTDTKKTPNVSGDYRRKTGKGSQNKTLRNRVEDSRALFSRTQLKIPLSQLRKRPDLLKSSFGSSISTDINGGDNSSISRDCVTSKDSMLALQGISVTIGESLFENFQFTQLKHDEAPLVVFKGMHPDESSGSSINNMTHDVTVPSCSQLPLCKRIMGKYGVQNGRESRSSSVESVKAETLPDLDNPLLPIAGKIANEPVNPFPILKKAFHRKPSQAGLHTKRRSSTGAGKLFSSLDIQRIEQDVERELSTFQTYRNVSEFFSQSKASQKRKTVKGTNSSSTRHNLTRYVTNPLYKKYDPAGYQKSEDELAVECIQMVCDDLNKWIKSLNNNNKRSGQDVSVEEHDTTDAESSGSEKYDDDSIVGPDFLIQILRKELELPEEYQVFNA